MVIMGKPIQILVSSLIVFCSCNLNVRNTELSSSDHSCKPTVQQPLHRDSSVTMPTYFFKGEKRVLIPSYENEYDIDSMLSKYVQSQIDPNAYDGCIFNYIIKYRVDTLGEIHDVVIVNTHSGEKSLDRQVKTAIEKLPLTPAIEGSQVFPIDIISRIKLDWVTYLTP